MEASFGSLLRQHRGLRGLTQEELAERSGLTVQAISLLERGHRLPRSTTVEFLADALKLNGQQRDAFTAAGSRQRAADERNDDDVGAAPPPAGGWWRRPRRRTLALAGLAVALVTVPLLAAVVGAHLTAASRIAPPPSCSSSYPCPPTTAVVNFNGKCLDMLDGSGSDGAAQISRCDRRAAQFQRLVSLDSTDFLIQNANSGKCFSIRDHDKKPGGAVVPSPCVWSGGDQYQRWYLLDPTADGFVQIANRGDGGLVMRPTGCRPMPGTRISMHVSGECRADRWKF